MKILVLPRPRLLAFLAGLVLLIFVQCSQRASDPAVPPDASLKTIILDSANLIQLYLPAAMDSTAKWDADCCTGGLYTTAFWDNRYPFIKTMHGLCFPQSLPDSICQVTVDWRTRRGESVWNDTLHLNKYKYYIESIQNDAYRRKVDWEKSEIRVFGQQRVAILSFKGFIHNSWVNQDPNCCETLLLSTVLNGKAIHIWFECAGKQCTGFIERMMPFAETIRFY